jgi:hypothetical protein
MQWQCRVRIRNHSSGGHFYDIVSRAVCRAVRIHNLKTGVFAASPFLTVAPSDVRSQIIRLLDFAENFLAASL